VRRRGLGTCWTRWPIVSERYGLGSTVDDVSLASEDAATEPHKDLQSLLARDVRSYMRVRGQGDDAEAFELRSVCAGLARFLGQLLEAREEWSRYQWVYAVLPKLAAVVSDEELTVLGLMIWGEKGQARQWVEPLFATLRVSESGEELLGYYVMCGDAAAGLRKLPYETHAKVAGRSDPEDWIFVFSQGQL
jgi:hypothetical protein